MSTLSAFGQLVRASRLKENLKMTEMASELGVSPSYLSAVEFGRRPVPQSWLEPISRMLKLTKEDAENLGIAAAQSSSRSRGAVSVELNDLTPFQEEVAMEFAMKVKLLSDEDLQVIRNHLAEERFSERNWIRGTGEDR